MAEYIANFTLNFVFIFSTMVLFFLPFTAIFWWRNRREISRARPHFNYFMEKFFLSRESNFLVASWAAAEAVIWFIIPEFLLILVLFMKVKGKAKLVVYDVLGTIVGTIIALVLHVPETLLTRFPYIYPKMIEQVHSWYDQHGVFGLVFQPFSGVPYKVFTHLAPDYHFFIPLFIVIAVVVRMSRYVIIYELGKAVYPLLHKFVRKHYLILFVVAIIIFTFMLMRVSQTYGPGYRVS